MMFHCIFFNRGIFSGQCCICRYDDNPFALKKEDRYSSWTSNNKTSSWETNRFDEKQTNAIEEIPSAKDDDR